MTNISSYNLVLKRGKFPSHLLLLFLLGDRSGMRFSVIMAPHELAHLDRKEIHNSVLPTPVHCVPYYEHHSRLALQIHPERECPYFILFYFNVIEIGNRFGAGVYTSSASNK